MNMRINHLAKTLGLVLLYASLAVPAYAADAHYDQIIVDARAGNYQQAIDYLNNLVQSQPNNLRAHQDLLAITSWAKQYPASIEQYQWLARRGLTDLPDYVIAAAATSYRGMQAYPQALQLYRQAIYKNPGRWDVRLGEIMTLVDIGEVKQALTRIDGLKPNAAGDRLDELELAQGYVYEHSGQSQAAQAVYLKIVARNSGQADARRRLALLMTDTPQAGRAAILASDAPSAFKPEELRRFEGNAAAQLVRRGMDVPTSELNRFGDTDLAITKLEDQKDRFAKDPDAAESYRRAAYDRIVALRDRVRMQEVLVAYKEVRDLPNPEEIPPEIEQAVGDAYLYLRHPEQAEKFYQSSLKRDPNDLRTWEGLYYSQIEQEHYRIAMKTLQTLKARANQAKPADWRYAQLLSARAQQYADDLAGAQHQLEPIVRNNPEDVAANTALGDVYRGRGWPRAAVSRYTAAQRFDSGSVKALGWQVGQAYNNMALTHYPQVNEEVEHLRLVYPENRSVQRLMQDWDIAQRPELYVRYSPIYRANTIGTGWHAMESEVSLYGPTFYENRTRLYASFTQIRDKLREANGYWRRYALGAQQRWQDWRFNAAVSDNDYYNDNHRVGFMAEGTYLPSDFWQYAVRGEVMSADTPLRAVRNGVTANSVSGSVKYTQNELWNVKGRLGNLSFSDNNNRTYYGVDGQWRWLNYPHMKADLLSSVSGSFNSKQNVSYFSPKNDLGLNIGPRFEQNIYRRYDVKYSHYLSVLPGYYWQSQASGEFIGSLTYGQRLEPFPAMNTGWNVTLAHQAYDGKPENAIALSWDMDWRF